MVNGDKTHIREVFLRPLNAYGLGDVARLTGFPPGKLRREVRLGYRDAVKVGRVWRFTWRQLAFVALERWTLAEIHAALGDDAARALPPLLSLRSVTVRLPEYMVKALEAVACKGRITIDAALHGELIDFAGVMMSPRMEAVAPGYRAAYLFPDRTQP